MYDSRKYLEPPKFLCIRDRILVLCIAGIFALLSIVSIIITLTKDYAWTDFIGDAVTLFFEILVIIGAIFMTKLTLQIAKISLIIQLIIVLVLGLFVVVYDTSSEATGKVDDSLDVLFSTNTTGMFEVEQSPEEMFKSALKFGFALEIVFIIGIAIIYLQYFLINRLLKYVTYRGVNGQHRVSP
ncbi:hypothetical protein CAEBREN_00755 [Caenorhabditis brenneri]|uniref:Uncharacterized protein n=1 Tax=Caenorhabditis brenneri TaxID=135651 RepID=G0MPA8_CAEBE|nr:hypothetical protein CAEBREN_00755 [Caenorhabditis brenneri]